MDKRKFISLFILMFILAPYLYGYECAGNTPDYIAPEYLGRGVAYCPEWRMFAGTRVTIVLKELFINFWKKSNIIPLDGNLSGIYPGHLFSPLIFGLLFSALIVLLIYLGVTIRNKYFLKFRRRASTR